MKPPRISESFDLRRALAELAIIVVGVLIALAAQSWWEGREIEADRRQSLSLLSDDLTRLETSLRDRTGATEVDSAIHRLVGNRPPEGDSALSSAMADALWNFGFDIGARDGENLLPAYADLKASGRLQLLPDTVRARMPGVELQLVILSRFLDDLVNFQQLRVDPVLYQRFQIEASTITDDGVFRLADAERFIEVFAEPEVRNLLLLKSSLLRGNLDRWAQTADSVAAVRRLIDSATEGD
jgi:hypothetical protein